MVFLETRPSPAVPSPAVLDPSMTLQASAAPVIEGLHRTRCVLSNGIPTPYQLLGGCADESDIMPLSSQPWIMRAYKT